MKEIGAVERVERKWRKGFTVALEGDRRVFQGRSLILNAPLHAFAGLLGRRGKSLSRMAGKGPSPVSPLPRLFGNSRKGGSCRHERPSCLDPRSPKTLRRRKCPLPRSQSEGRRVAAPEGCRALTVQSLVPYDAFRSWNQVSFASHQESVMKHVNRLIPFLDRFLEFADFDWAREQVRRWSYPHFIYEAVDGFDWRKGLVPNRLSRDLYFIGKENFPYLGLEGEVLSGLRVAREMLEKR